MTFKVNEGHGNGSIQSINQSTNQPTNQPTVY